MTDEVLVTVVQQLISPAIFKRAILMCEKDRKLPIGFYKELRSQGIFVHTQIPDLRDLILDSMLSPMGDSK